MTDEIDGIYETKIKEAVQRFVAEQIDGQRPNIEEFVKQYPGLEERLRKRIESLQKVDTLFEELTRADDKDLALLDNEENLVGRRIANFEVTEIIASGGMGVVYRAHDTRLDRDVAVKALCIGLLGDSTSQMRFQREAQMLASLDHPNIGAIFDIVEESECLSYLILEYVPGPTLAERLSHGRIEYSKALEIAYCIAKAMSAAYSKGVVHRDLKPSNIKITPDGVIKVLDFGIARAIEIGKETLEPIVTQPGHFVGTPAYASPEQLQGGTIDHRSDIWSFGCILYEMLTGLPPFSSGSFTNTLANVLRDEPDWTVLPVETPTNIRTLIRRCLEKDPNHRLQHIGDAAIEINESLKEPQDSSALSKPFQDIMHRRIWPVVVWCCIAGLGVGLIVGLFLRWPHPFGEASDKIRRFTITLPEDQVLSFQTSSYANRRPAFALSPDGSRLVYVAQEGQTARIFERRIDSFESRQIAGTEGASSPFFSPDGQSVGFFANNKLKTVSLLGGEPTNISSANFYYRGSWGSDGMIYTTVGGKLARVPVSGGEPELLLVDSEPLKAGNLQILPDGKTLLVTSPEGTVAVFLETMKKKVLIEDVQYSHYVPSGHLLYIRTGAVEAVSFDVGKCEVTSRPVPVLEGVMLSSGEGTAQFTCSDEGLLIYAAGGDTRRTIPIWKDREGNVEELGMPARTYGALRLSPDGKRLAIVVKEDRKSNVYIYDIFRRTETRLTSENNNDRPLWTPDSQNVVFGRYDETEEQGYIISAQADGSGKEDLLTSAPYELAPYSWSPNGKLLALYGVNKDVILRLDEKLEMQSILENEISAWAPAFSRDGHWIAYTSNRDGGDSQVYIRPYPDMDRVIRISHESGEEPIWSVSGDELFYRNKTKWMVVSISTEPEFIPGTPQVLFEGPFGQVDGLSYDVTPDGQRFLVLKPKYDDSKVRELHVVTNWFEELKKLVATSKAP